METKLPLPIVKDDLANREQIRANSTRGGEIYRIAYDNIKIRPDHNDRIHFGNLDELADNIEAVGLISPIRGDMKKDGSFVVTNGERRTRAIGILLERGSKRFNKTDKCVMVIINPPTFTEVDRIKISLSENNMGKAFEPIEEANSFKKLLGQIDPDTGKVIRSADIARIMGCSKMHVTNRLYLAGISDEEKDAVNDGVISATAMTDLVKNGVDAEERKEMINSAKEKGSKLQVKDVKQKNESGLSSAISGLQNQDTPPKDDAYTADDHDKNDHINSVMGSDNNAEADHQEKQEAGLFAKKSGGPTFTVFSQASEALLLLDGIGHELHKEEFSLTVVEAKIETLYVTLKNLQKIGKAL